MNLHKADRVTRGAVTPELASFRRSGGMRLRIVTRYATWQHVHLPSAARMRARAGAHPHTHKGVPYLSNYVTEVEEKKKDQVNTSLCRYAARYAAATHRVTPTPSSPARTEVTHA